MKRANREKRVKREKVKKEKKQRNYSVIRAVRGLEAQKWFRALSTFVLDSLMVVMFGYFLLYRAGNWWNGDKIFFIPADTWYLATDILLWAAIALEIFWSPVRSVPAVILMLIRNRPATTYPQLLFCEAILLILVSNLGSRRNNRNTWLSIHGVGIAVLFFLRILGVGVPSYSPDMTYIFSYPGTSLAFSNANTLAIVMMTMMLICWLPRNWRGKNLFIAILLGAEAIIMVTQCRTVALLMFLLVPVMAWTDRQLGKSYTKGRSLFFGLMPGFVVLLTLIISLYAVKYKVPVIAQDYNPFWMRFTDFRVITNYSFSLFGSTSVGPYQRINFDNFYWWLLHYCGLIPTIIALCAYGWMNMRLYRLKDRKLLALSLLFLIYGIMENALIYPFHFFVPLLAFARPQEDPDKYLADYTAKAIKE